MSQASEIDQEMAAKLHQKLREEPESIIRTYPEVALELADEARLDGHEKLADRIESLFEAVQEDSA